MYTEIIRDRTFDQERALYGSTDLDVAQCRFDGPADGESAFKECENIRVADSFFNLRYPFWHDTGLILDNCELTPLCRAALWYSEDVQIRNCQLHGIKALRECGRVDMANCDVISAEFGWSVRGIHMTDCQVQGEYFMLRSCDLHFENVKLLGKYSFQYIENAVFENCHFDTKDAFWHAKHVTVRNSFIKGEYLAWYCEDVTFENCVISGTQPLCYCKGLKLINCRMENADLCFERSQVEATLTDPVVSIKNPFSGYIAAPGWGELILDEPKAKATVLAGAPNTPSAAKQILLEQGYTCVICGDAAIHTTTLRGVRPLVRWLTQGVDMSGCHGADKVIGKATAFLYCLLGVRSVYAGIISESALEVLQTHSIAVEYGALVPHIINRTGDGICPFEAAVLEIHRKEDALPAILAKMEQMQISL